MFLGIHVIDGDKSTWSVIVRFAIMSHSIDGFRGRYGIGDATRRNNSSSTQLSKNTVCRPSTLGFSLTWFPILLPLHKIFKACVWNTNTAIDWETNNRQDGKRPLYWPLITIVTAQAPNDK
jgi:hypothetical protein